MKGLPELVRPMLATPGKLPGPPDEARWSFEMKWDGVRAIAYVGAGPLRLLTRNDRDVAATYPELAGLDQALAPRRAVLDGEVVAFDPAGRPSFGELQTRMHVQHPTSRLLAAAPVTYLVFDLLHVDDEPLLHRAYDDRREALAALGLGDDHWAAPPAFDGEAAAASELSRSRGLEGVVAKRRASTYTPGHRSKDWVKVKHERMQEVVIGGWAPGEGRRSGGIGSLLVGVPDDSGRLLYAGHVGTGFTVRALDHLEALLRPLAKDSPPFANVVPPLRARHARWVDPRLVGEVSFTEWTRDGRLRQPSWRGLRPEKTPGDVGREPA